MTLTVCGFVGPKLPFHLELVGGVLVEEFHGLGDSVFNERVGYVGGVVFGAFVEDVNALVYRRLGEVHRDCGGRRDARKARQAGELVQHANGGRGECVELEVGKPDA